MPLMPIGARLFAAVRAFRAEASSVEVTPDQVTQSVPGYSGNQGAFLKDVIGVDLKDKLNTPNAIRFSTAKEVASDPNRASWTATAAGTGRFIFGDPSAAVFIGFANGSMPIDLSQSNVLGLNR